MNLPTKSYKIIMNNGEMLEVEGKVFQTMMLPKNSFAIRKKNKGGYIVDHMQSGMNLAIETKTEQEAFDELQKLLKDKDKVAKIKATLPIKEIHDKLMRFKECVDEFESITHLKLPVTIFGVNVIELDSKLEVPQGISTLDYIKDKYGENAGDLVEEMTEGQFFYNPDNIIGFWLRQSS